MTSVRLKFRPGTIVPRAKRAITSAFASAERSGLLYFEDPDTEASEIYLLAMDGVSALDRGKQSLREAGRRSWSGQELLTRVTA